VSLRALDPLPLSFSSSSSSSSLHYTLPNLKAIPSTLQWLPSLVSSKRIPRSSRSCVSPSSPHMLSSSHYFPRSGCSAALSAQTLTHSHPTDGSTAVGFGVCGAVGSLDHLQLMRRIADLPWPLTLSPPPHSLRCLLPEDECQSPYLSPAPAEHFRLFSFFSSRELTFASTYSLFPTSPARRRRQEVERQVPLEFRLSEH
jgi:hypothetical protein